MEKNLVLMQSVRNAIADEAQAFNQSEWWSGTSEYGEDISEVVEIPVSKNGEFCNTAGCLAGHTVSIIGRKRALEIAELLEDYTIPAVAGYALGLEHYEEGLLFEASYPVASKCRPGCTGWYKPRRKHVVEALDLIIKGKRVEDALYQVGRMFYDEVNDKWEQNDGTV